MKNLLKNKELQSALVMAVTNTAIIITYQLFIVKQQKLLSQVYSEYLNYYIYSMYLIIFLTVFFSAFFIKKAFKAAKIEEFKEVEEKRDFTKQHKKYSKRVAKLKAQKCKRF